MVRFTGLLRKYPASAVAIALLLSFAACSPLGQGAVSAQRNPAPENAPPQGASEEGGKRLPPLAPPRQELANPLPPTSAETIELLKFIAAEQARTREAMSAFDFEATEHRIRHEGGPGEETFVLDRIRTVTRGDNDQLLLNEEQKDALTPAGTGAPRLGAHGFSVRNSGKPLVNRYLRLPDMCVIWLNVLQSQLIFRNKQDWVGNQEKYDRCGMALRFVDPAVLSTTMMGERTFGELATSLTSKGDAKWFWSVVRESDSRFRVNQWSRWAQDYLLNSYAVDMSKGGVVTEAAFTPRESGGMGRTARKSYISVDGVYLLQEHFLKLLDEEGKPFEDVTIAYSNYKRSQLDRVFSLSDLQIPDNAFFSRMLPNPKSNGGVFKLKDGKLVETVLDENREPK